MKDFKLKKVMLSMLIIFAMIFATDTAATAQKRPAAKKAPQAKVQPQNKMFRNIPNLTEAQKEQIKKLRTAMMKDILPLRNLLGEKRAKLRTLSTAETPDMKAINKVIDEVAELQARIQKRRMKFMQDVRALLTDEQRVAFDSRFGMHRGGKSGPPGGHCRR